MPETVKSALASWRTTALGILGGVLLTVGVLFTTLGGDVSQLGSALQPDMLRLYGEIALAMGLVQARDNKVSSEKAGAE